MWPRQLAQRELLGESENTADSLAVVSAKHLFFPHTGTLWAPAFFHDRGEGEVRGNPFFSELRLPLDDGGGWVGVMRGSPAPAITPVQCRTDSIGNGYFAS
jgi:hypothetical protein